MSNYGLKIISSIKCKNIFNSINLSYGTNNLFFSNIIKNNKKFKIFTKNNKIKYLDLFKYFIFENLNVNKEKELIKKKKFNKNYIYQNFTSLLQNINFNREITGKLILKKKNKKQNNQDFIINKESFYNTLKYMYINIGKGIYCKIKDSILVSFIPFINNKKDNTSYSPEIFINNQENKIKENEIKELTRLLDVP